jgi:hypothetical protein
MSNRQLQAVNRRYRMAIDLCNKVQHLQVGLEDVAWVTDPTESLAPMEDPEADAVRRKSSGSDRDLSSPIPADPAAWDSNFAHVLDRVAVRLDARPSELLRQEALGHPDPVMREQALFEYADRNEADAFELLAEAIETDSNRELRWDALWAIEKLGGNQAMRTLQRFLDDPDPEIAEWAGLFLSELRTGNPAFDGRSCLSTPGRTFDETIYLLIHCDLYIRLGADNRQWGKLSLAPQSLARIYGQAHACPNVETRERQLVIAKTIEGLHADGSPHVDNYLFRGFTERTRADRGAFCFESAVRRPVYLSGRADDPSEGTRDAVIGFTREGCWYLDDRFPIRGAPAIRYVRGRFQGWGYTNLRDMAGKGLDEIIRPGNGVLATLHDPVVGPLANVYIAGTFKGKLNDWDGDGRIDLNSRNVYSTTEGEIDMNMDGVADVPGMSCCNWVSPL